MPVLLALAILLSSALVQTLQAQIIRNLTDGTTPPGIAPGSPAGTYALSDLDNVNLYNGSLSFRLPLWEIIGRGDARYTMTLPIEHRWTIDRAYYSDGNTIYYPHTAWWSALAVGYGPGVLEGRSAIEEEFCPNGSSIVTYTLLRLTFTAPDGTEHELRDKLTDGLPDAVTEYNCLGGVPPLGFDRGREFVSRDGTTMTFFSDQSLRDDLSGLSIRPTGNLMFRDGTMYRIVNGLVESIRDRNGNLLTFEYDQYKRVTKVTDSLKRATDVIYGSVVPFPDIIRFKGYGAATREIRVWRSYMQDVLHPDYTAPEIPKTISGLFPELDTPDNTPHNPIVVSAVQLPDGRQYQFLYNNYGELARVTLPTGGVIEYVFGTSTGFDSGSYGSTMVCRRVKQRRVYADGTILERRTYFTAPVAGGPDPQVVTVRHEDGGAALQALDDHRFYGRPTDAIVMTALSYPKWNEGREYQAESLDLNGSTLLRRLYHTWAQRDANNNSVIPPDNTIPNDPRIIDTFTTLETGQQSRQSFVYSIDPYNNRTDTYEYDFGATTWTRRTHVDYVTSAAYTDVGVHLRSLPLQESVFESTGTEKSRTTYEYDNYSADGNHAPLVSRSNISQLHASFGTGYVTRGNATAVTRWLLPGGAPLSSYQQFDVAGNAVKSIDARGKSTNFDFADRFGNPDWESQSNSAPGELAGQTSFAFPTKITNALNHVSYTQYYYYLGKPVNTEDANGVVHSIAYADSLDRPSQVVRAEKDANNTTTYKSQTTFAYYDSDRLHRTTSDLNWLGDNQVKSELRYDGLGRTVETRQYETAGYISTQQTYDAMGRIRQVSNPYRPGLEPLVWTLTQYDLLGRVKRVTTPDGAMVDTVYQGNESNVVDQAAKQRKMTYDALGRLVTVIENPMAVLPEVPYQTSYLYDVLDNLTAVEQGGQARSFAYDSLRRLTSATNPETGPGAISYQYDNNGNLTQKTDARGTITYAYDDLNRLLSRTYTDGTPTVTYEYDAATVLHSKGRLTKVTSTVSIYGYDEYDALGRVERSSQVTAGNQYVIKYTYDLAGNMTSQTYSSGWIVNSSYDGAGRRLMDLSGTAGLWQPIKPYATSFSHASHGPLKSIQLANGLWEQTNFNNRLQASEIGLGTTSTNSSLLRLDYAYGGTTNNGNVLSQTITAPGLNLIQSYSYDGLNRLQQAVETGSWSQSYGYDQYGNRWVEPGSYLPNPGLTPQYENDFNPNNNRLAASQYDSAGNQTQDVVGNTYVYNLDNLQTNFNGTAATYSYDGEGRRVKKTDGSGTTIFVYNAGGQLIAEYSDVPPSGPGGTSYVTADHLGSTRVVTHAGGEAGKRYDYLPFGEEIPCSQGGRCSVAGYSSADSTRQKFTGKERDAESGLDYLLARYCSGAQGRFASPDPDNAGAIPSDPQSWNAYAYVRNNPMLFVDPDGTAYRICDADGKNCVEVSDKQYTEWLSKAKDNLYVKDGKVYQRGVSDPTVLGTVKDLGRDQLLAVAQGASLAAPVVRGLFEATMAFVALAGPGAMSRTTGEVASFGAARSGIQATIHGAEQIAERAFSAADIALTKTGRMMTQADGARVFIKK